MCTINYGSHGCHRLLFMNTWCVFMQRLNFYGYLKILVLGGVVNVDSYVIKPGDRGVTVCVPQGIGSTAVSMEAMDPAMTVSCE